MKKVIIAFVVPVLLAGCSSERINGPVETRTWDLADFDRIELRGVGDVQVINGTENKVDITTHADLFDNISAFVQDNELIIDLQGEVQNVDVLSFDVFTTHPLYRVQLTGVGNIDYSNPDKDSHLTVDLDGVGNIHINGIESARVTARLTDVGDLTLSGAAREIDYLLTGVGDIRAFELAAGTGAVDLDGVGNIEVYAVDTLNISHHGVGKVLYKGNPYVRVDQGDDIVRVD